MKHKNLPERAIWSFRFNYALATLAEGFFCGLAAVFSFKVFLLLTVTSLLLSIYLIFFYTKIKYKSINYAFDGDDSAKVGMVIFKGVCFKQRINIRLRQVQYIEILINPVQRALALCTIVFHMSGAKVRLPQIFIEEGEALKEWHSNMTKRDT